MSTRPATNVQIVVYKQINDIPGSVSYEHGSLITRLNDSLCARLYETSTSEKKIQTHSEPFICVKSNK